MENKEKAEKIFSEVRSDRMKGNADMLQQRKVWLTIRK